MFRRVLIFMFLLLALAIPTGAAAQETGSITGTVSNGTPDGGSPAGLTVTLSRFQGMNLAQEYTTTTDAQGQYSFADLPITDGEAYIARATYRDVEYPGTMVLLTNEPNPTVDISVYETTNDPASITLLSRGVVIAGADADLRLVEVFEILAIDNTTDRTYVGNNGEVLRLPLPDGTAQITPQPGFDFGDARIDRGALVTTGAIPPGSQNAIVAYSVPYKATEATITIGTAMPTQTLRVLVREGTYDVSSPALNDSGTVDVSGDQYHALSVDKPIVGDTVSVRVSGLPKAGSSGDSSRGPLYAAIAAGAGLVAAAGLVYQTLRKRGQVATMPTTISSADRTSIEEERLALAARLNQLDEDRATERIDQEQYEQRRAKVLAEIRSLSRQLHGLEDAGA